MSAKILTFYTPDMSQPTTRPLFMCKVPAGFPSPADDYLDRNLDLNDYFIRHASATFYVYASGDSMIDAGIHHGDLMIVDRALEARHGSIVIAVIDGELTVKQLRKENGQVWLMPANPRFNPIRITPEQEFLIWGVVSGIARKFNG